MKKVIESTDLEFLANEIESEAAALELIDSDSIEYELDAHSSKIKELVQDIRGIVSLSDNVPDGILPLIESHNKIRNEIGKILKDNQTHST